MNNKKLKLILSFSLSFLLLIAEGITFLAISKLDMLPDTLMLAVGGLLLLLWIVCTLMLLLPSKKQRSGRAIAASILVVLFIAGNAVVTNIVGTLYETMHSITKPSVTTVSMMVYIKADDPACAIKDTAGYPFGVSYVSGVEITNDAITDVQSKIGSNIQTIVYNSVPEMVNALYKGEVKAIIMDSAYVSLLEEFELYADFHTRTKVIHEVVVEEIVIPPVETKPSEPPATENKPEGMEPFVIYLSGTDSRSGSFKRSRSDVNILAVVNPQTKQILLVNTPRDYYVPNPAGKGVQDKLTHCGIYGVDCSVKALSTLYDVPIKYNAQINFFGFHTLIDVIGGITVYSDIGFNAAGGKYYFPAGPVELDGERALVFARERHGVPGGDSTRGKNQMKVITAVVNKLTSGTTIISNYTDIMNSLQGMFQTNVEMDTVSELVKMQLKDMSSWNIKSYAVTGKGSNQITFSMPGKPLYVMLPNEASVNHGQTLIDRVLNGDVLTDADLTVPAN